MSICQIHLQCNTTEENEYQELTWHIHWDYQPHN